MTSFPKKLQEKLARREAEFTLRHLPPVNDLVDFSSNDYLGLSRNDTVFRRASQLVSESALPQNGATGSRLLSGNHSLYHRLEAFLSEFHQSASALVFNSGYDANIGFFGAVPQRGDLVLYDELVHASIRDGITMGNAQSYKFKHNDIDDVKAKFKRIRNRSPAMEIYMVTESVFSMDGDSPDLHTFVKFCKENNVHLIVDEAHAIGVIGTNGEGLVRQLRLEDAVFARTITFGKAMGCHGAVILGARPLKEYLVNFARSLIYTTGLPPHSVATILASYERITSDENDANAASVHLSGRLSDNIVLFNDTLKKLNLTSYFIRSTSAIHCCVLPGNERVRAISEEIQKNNFDVKAILSPTVARGQERLRICLHSFNTKEEIQKLLEILSYCINTL